MKKYLFLTVLAIIAVAVQVNADAFDFSPFRLSGTNIIPKVISWRLGVGTSTPGTPLGVTGAGVFSGPLSFESFTASSTSATSTARYGINITGGCFAVSGTCVGGGGGSGTINSGTTNRAAYYSGATTLDSANYLTTDITNGRLGIGTSTPYATLSVVGEVVAPFYTATSTTATTTLSGGLAIETSGLVYDFSTNNVGIGTAAPNAPLDVRGTANIATFGRTTSNAAGGYLQIRDASTVVGYFGYGTSLIAGAGATGPFVIRGDNDTAFAQAGTQRMRVTTGGVNIGTSVDNASRMLHVTSGVGTDGLRIQTTAGASQPIIDLINPSTTWQIYNDGANSDRLTFAGGGTPFVILTNGNLGIGTSTPGTKLGVTGDAVIAGDATFRRFNATSTTATSTIQGFLDVLGTGTNSTSTYSSNLWVKGSLQIGSGSVTITENGITSSGALTVSGSGTTTYGAGVSATNIALTSTTATSTGSNGFNLTGGCFAVSGTCVGANAGTVTSIDVSAGGTGMTFTGGPVTTSGTITLSGVLGLSAGGTNSTVYSSGSVIFASATRLDQDNANFYWDDINNRLGIASTTPTSPLSVTGATLISGTTTTSGLITSVNAGIGTTTPWTTLGVAGRVAISGLGSGAAGDNAICINPSTLELRDAGGSACVASSIRYKENIKTFDTAISTIQALNPVSFSYKTQYDHGKIKGARHFGLIAEEVEKVDKMLVGYEKDGKTPKTVKYDELTSVILQGMKELVIWVKDHGQKIDKIVEAIKKITKTDTAQNKHIKNLSTGLVSLRKEVELLKKQIKELTPLEDVSTTNNN